MKKLTVLLLFWVFTGSAASASDWPLFGHDAARSGVTADQGITLKNVSRLHRRWQVALPDVADAAPIVVGNRLFLTSKGGTTYAVDNASGHILWRFTTHGPNITTSVPAYDAATQSLYVSGVDGFVHKLDPATGREIRAGGFPAQITLAPETEKNASSLNVANGFLYAQTSGYYGDATPYVGHVVAIRLSDGTKHVFNTLCSTHHGLMEPQDCAQQRSGMWSRAGVVVDPDPAMRGQLYVATGNGPFDLSASAYGDSVLSLASDATRLTRSFTPQNFSELESSDLDLGSSSPALLPRQADSSTPLLAVQGGKDGFLRLLDRTNFGGLGHALQTIDLGYKVFCAPAVWTDSQGDVLVFIDIKDGVHAYKLITANRKSRLVTAWRADVAQAYEGSSPVLDNGVLFIATSGALIALDAQTGHEVWKGTIGDIHWESPAIANGAIYCSDESGHLTAFGL